VRRRLVLLTSQAENGEEVLPPRIAFFPEAPAALQADVEEAARWLEVALASLTPAAGPQGNGTGDDVP
jgi:hypothetical protein